MNNLSPFKKCAVVPFAVAMLGYLPITHTIPSVAMKMFGNPYRSTVTVMRKEHEDYRGQRCYRIFSAELEDYWYGNVCTTKEVFSALKPGDKLKLEGRQSWFGIVIEAYYW